ncbi:MAG TPA: hypothetical protein VMM80_03755, partial [Bacteroidota bacterium]|nr:hypothetical protein [Bacteroidota bacterium]
EMLRVRRACLSKGTGPIAYPHRLVDEPADHVAWPDAGFDLEKLYPLHHVFGRRDLTAMQNELEAALGTVERLHAQVDTLTDRLHRIPGYTLLANIQRAIRRRRPR